MYKVLNVLWIKKAIFCFFKEGTGQWLSLDAELVMKDGEVVGTKMATGHSLLVDCRFELPFGKYQPAYIKPANSDAILLLRQRKH